MVFNAIVNTISVISWPLAITLLVYETGVPGENHRSAASYCQTLSHNVVSSTPRLGRRFNYHAITTTTDLANIRSVHN